MTPIVAGFLASGGVGGLMVFLFAFITQHQKEADEQIIENAAAESRNSESDTVMCWAGNVVAPPPPILLCPRCNDPSESKSVCNRCIEEQKTVRTTVTDFDAYMACPWCDHQDFHLLREAHPAPTFENLPDLQYKFAAFKQDKGMLEHGYATYLRRNADVVIEGFGQSTPVRVVMNNPAAEAHARKLRPPRVSIDSPKLSKYDHPDATTIRTCTSCGKEWSQK